jgi:hypothetical protein
MSCVERDGSTTVQIKTNDMGVRMIEEGDSPSILLNSAKMSFDCGGGREVNIEGYFIGEINRDAVLWTGSTDWLAHEAACPWAPIQMEC